MSIRKVTCLDLIHSGDIISCDCDLFQMLDSTVRNIALRLGLENRGRKNTLVGHAYRAQFSRPASILQSLVCGKASLSARARVMDEE